MIPESKFEPGDYVRATDDLSMSPYAGITGIVREKQYEQCVHAQTGEPIDLWSWGYKVEFELGTPAYTAERFLRKARIDE